MKPLSSAVVRTASQVDRWHWVLVLAASPFLLFPSAGTAPMLLILPVIWMAGLVAKREPFPRTPLNLALAVLCAMVLVSEWATFDLMWSLPKITGVVLGVSAFFAIVRVSRSPRGWWLSLAAFLGIGLAVSGFGLIGTRWGAKIAALNAFVERLVLRVTGIPGIEEGLNPNQLAGALTWVAPVLLALCGLVLAERQVLLAAWGRRVWSAVVVAVFSSTILVWIMLVLTESRSAYIGAAISVYVMAWAVGSRRWRRALLVVALIGILAGGILLWRGGLTAARSGFAGGEGIGGAAFSLASVEGRLELWSRGIYGIQDFPFTGMGMNAFRRVVNVFYPLFLSGANEDVGHAHNEFLQAALDLGIPGLVAFIALYVGALAMLRSTWILVCDSPGGERSSSGGLQERLLVAGLGGGLLAHLLYGLTDAVALGAKPGVLFWMLLGLTTGLYQRVRTWEHSPRTVSAAESRSP